MWAGTGLIVFVDRPLLESDLNRDPMNGPERRAVTALAAVFGLRMFGLFLVLPVMALYASALDGATPLMVGMALGAYGLTQALFQIPFGMLSDRFGRKPLIVIGLAIFALGSVVAAMADTITGVVFGRALQGSGAIAAVVLALLADLTREQQRTKAMALVGMSIGASFLFALMAGPVVDRWVGVSGLVLANHGAFYCSSSSRYLGGASTTTHGS